MARPAMFGQPASESIRVRVTPQQRTDLERVAAANHTDVAGVIRDAVNEYVSDFGGSRPFVVQNEKPGSH